MGRLDADLEIQILPCMYNANPPFQVCRSVWRAMLDLCVFSLEFVGIFCCASNIVVQLVWSKMLQYVCVTWL